MNILFISHWDQKKESNIGIKLQGQVNALEELGHTVTALKFRDGSVWSETKMEKIKLFNVSENGFAHLLAIPRAVKQLLNQHPSQYDMCYIRRTFCTPWHLLMLRALKENGVITVEELPTYPYDNEAKLYPKSYLVAIVIEKICRRFYHLWLDYFVTYSQHDFVFKVPAINLENGIDIHRINCKKGKWNREDKTIDLITISSMKQWHGFERLIKGLSDYKEQLKKDAYHFRIHMVGDGEMRSEWERLANSLGIGKQVIFYGNKTGKELDEIFEKTSIAVATLGFYKMSKEGEIHSSALKVREYMARGIPFIYSLREPSISEKSDFCMLVPNNDTAIDFEEIRLFYERLCKQEQDGRNIHEEIRKIAEKNYSWVTQMEKVTSLIEAEKFSV